MLGLVCCFLLNFLSQESEDSDGAQLDQEYQTILSASHGSSRVSDDPRFVTVGCCSLLGVSSLLLPKTLSQSEERDDAFPCPPAKMLLLCFQLRRTRSLWSRRPGLMGLVTGI